MKSVGLYTKTKPTSERMVFKGLCTNCENRKNCMIRDLSNVVNYCEEYS